MTKKECARRDALNAKYEQCRKLGSEIRAIEAQKEARLNSKFVGKCYKTQNSYGTGGDSPWWLYKMVTHGGANMRAFQFEQTSTGGFDVRAGHYASEFALRRGDYIEIPHAEFLLAWKTYVTNMLAAFPMRTNDKLRKHKHKKVNTFDDK